MANPNSPQSRRTFLQRSSVAMAGTAVAGGLPALAFGAEQAMAADGAAANPIVAENQLTDQSTWTSDFRVKDVSSQVVGFARRTSVDLGEDIEISASGPNAWLPPDEDWETVEVELYRLGYYGGKGGRLVWKSPGPVSVYQKVDATGKPANDYDGGKVPDWAPLDPHTGLYGVAGHRTVLTIPGNAITVSGVYLAKLKGKWRDYPPGVPAVEVGGESHVVVVVRDDARPRDILALLPTNTWQAYNYWGGRSLYTYNSRYGVPGNIVPATGTERAAKVSLDRPYNIWIADYNWVLHSEFAWIYWAEQQGYDIAYTDDVALTYGQEQALPTSSKSVAILGHGEYWTKEERDALEAARDAGTHIYNFGANTAYWRVRYETVAGAPATTAAEARVMVCYKTIEGGGTNALDVWSEADPVAPTTTWRDTGKGPRIYTPGTRGATPTRYTGNDRPESALLGVQYIGDDDNGPRPLTVPADNGNGEFAGHRAWRNTPLAKKKSSTDIGTNLLGWEWDGIPPATDPWGAAPPMKPGTTLQRLSESDPRLRAANSNTVYVLDGGRRYSPPGAEAQPGPNGTPYAHAVTYTAPSGALVFSSGTIRWSFGLGPHHVEGYWETFVNPPTDSTSPIIQQATTNLFLDGGITPATPVGVVLTDPVVEQPPKDTVPPDITAGVTNSTGRYLIFTTVTYVSKRTRTISFRVSLSSKETSGPVALAFDLKDASGSLGTATGSLAAGSTKTFDLVIGTTPFKRITSPYRKATATVTATDTAGNKTTKTIALNLRPD